MSKINSNIIRVISNKQTFLNRLAAGNINSDAFVYIEETLEIWHNYKYYGSLVEITAALTAEIKRAKDAEASIEAKLLFKNIKVDVDTGELYLIYEAESPDDGDSAVSDLYSEVVTLDDTFGEYLAVTNENGDSIVVNNSNI